MIVYAIQYENGDFVNHSGWRTKDYSKIQFFKSYQEAKEDLKYRRSNGYCKVVSIKIEVIKENINV